MEILHAAISDTIFRNEDNNYSVIECRADEENVTVVGNLPAFSSGENVVFEGEWSEHPLYGKQFKAVRFEWYTPVGMAAIERYLSSGLIKGVGPSTARLIVQEFGGDTLQILSEHPERLTDIPGIGVKRAASIAESFAEQVAMRHSMIFLQSYNISPVLSMKIVKHYGENTEQALRSNPYQLIDAIDGIGFLTADRIAKSMGLPDQSEFRIRSCIKYALYEAAQSEGHTYLPRPLLVARAVELLRLSEELVALQLHAMLLDKEVIGQIADDVEIVFLSSFYRVEQEIALRLLHHVRTSAEAPSDDKTAAKIDRFEQRNGIVFSPKQREAISTAVKSDLLIITGGPGTGKTTIINCILDTLEGIGDIFLAAPTGRAAKRMSETTGHEAKTLHRLLEYGGDEQSFQHDQENPLDCGCLIVDEMSMVDVFLMRSLLCALRPQTKLILVGDADQLPSVGPGNVLGDMLQSGVLPTVRLDEIFRQEKESDIVLNAHRINHGEIPMVNQKESDFFYKRTLTAEETAQAVVTLCAERLPKYLKAGDPVQSIQVLSPTKKGLCGVENLNRLLQRRLNPPAPGRAEMAYGDILFRLGDKVIHKKNNYTLEWFTPSHEKGEGVFNGDIGFIHEINNDARTLTVLYDDMRHVVYEWKQLEDLDLAYCLSVHKSQGSEFPAVVMPAVGGPPMLLSRNLFYTAVTRARRLLVLCGYWEAVEQMVRNNHEARRFTALRDRLRFDYETSFPTI